MKFEKKKKCPSSKMNNVLFIVPWVKYFKQINLSFDYVIQIGKINYNC